jgi:hypothetical protein
LTADARSAQEDAVEEQANGDVNVADASEDTVASNRVEGLARVAEDEEYKYDVADAVMVAVAVSDDDRRFAGEALLTGPGSQRISARWTPGRSPAACSAEQQGVWASSCSLRICVEDAESGKWILSNVGSARGRRPGLQS